MFVYAILFLCLLPQLHGSPYPSNSIETPSHEYSDIGQRRVTRSTITKLPTAIRFLLEAAEQVPTMSVKYQKFIKPGNARNAARDYLALKPVFVRQQKFSFKGTVDDFNVRFRQSDPSQGQRPSLEISDKNGENKVKIVYRSRLARPDNDNKAAEPLKLLVLLPK